MRSTWRLLGVFVAAVVVSAGLATSRPPVSVRAAAATWVGTVDFVYTSSDSPNNRIVGGAHFTYRPDGSTFVNAAFTVDYYDTDCGTGSPLLHYTEVYSQNGTTDALHQPIPNLGNVVPSAGSPLSWYLAFPIAYVRTNHCSTPPTDTLLFWNYAVTGPQGNYDGSGRFAGTLANVPASFGFGDLTWDLTVVPADSDLGLANMPADVSVPATSGTGAVVTYTMPTATDEAGDTTVPTVVCDHPSGATFPVGLTTVVCTASDADDFPSAVSQSFAVTVTDTDLGITNVPVDIVVDAAGAAGAVVTYLPPTGTDEGPSYPPVSCAPASGSTFSIGTTTVSCTASDGDDTPSSVSALFTVTVNDTDLTITGTPQDITVDATDAAGAIVNYTPPTPVDEEPVDSFSCSHASGATFPVGTTNVSCSAFSADDQPSASFVSFNVTVRDSDLGITGVPASITTAATGAGGATVTYANPTATDEEAATASCSPASGSTFPVGTTTVTCAASSDDDKPNTVSASFTVTVTDTDLALTGMPANIAQAATSGAGAVVNYVAPTAVDEEAATASCSPSSGSTFPVGTTTVSCTASSDDDTPNTVNASFTITVTDTDLALTGVPANVTTAATSGAGAVVNYVAPIAVDEEAATASCSPASGSTFPVGTTTVNCSASSADDTPNSVSASFSVAVTPLLAQDVKLTMLNVVPFRTQRVGTYLVIVTNTGTVPTSGALTFTTTLPAGLSYAGVFQLGGWQCNATGQAVTCTFNRSLSRNGATFVLLFVRVTAPAGTTLTEVATVIPLDATPSDNTATVTVTVRG